MRSHAAEAANPARLRRHAVTLVRHRLRTAVRKHSTTYEYNTSTVWETIHTPTGPRPAVIIDNRSASTHKVVSPTHKRHTTQCSAPT